MGSFTSKESTKEEVAGFPTTCSITKQEKDVVHAHVWIFDEFKSKLDMEPGQKMKAGEFSFKIKGIKTEWNMMISPNGVDESTKGYLYICLQRLDDNDIPIQIEVTFGLTNTTRLKEMLQMRYYDTFDHFIL